MTTKTYNTQENLVKDLRKIRDRISDDIKGMTFAEERDYLDKLLAEKERSSHTKSITTSGAEQ